MIILQKKNTEKYNPNQPRILDHPQRKLKIGGSRSKKTNALPNLIKQQNDDDYNIMDKIYLYVKDPKESKY